MTDLAPTSPRPRPSRGATSPESTSPLAPYPEGGEVDLGSRGRPPLNTPPPRPRGDVSLPPTIAICGRCQRDIRHGQPYMSAIPFLGSWGGFWHQRCLVLVDGGR